MAEHKQEPWYKYGVVVLYIEMVIAIGVSIFAMVSTFKI